MMIVQCENCKAKFRLDESKVPEQGRRVRCSKCKHVFMVRRDTPAEPPKEEAVSLTPKEGEGVEPSWAREEMGQEAEPVFEPTVRIDLGSEPPPGPQLEEPPQGQEPVAPSARPRRRILAPLLTAGAVVAALAMIVVVLGKLGYLPFLFPEPQEPPISKLTIDQGQLEGKWEKNAQIPRIFVITGTVHNQSKKPRSFIKVRGLLLDKNGKVVKEVWAFCGNPIPIEDLRTKAPGELEKVMHTREGQKGSNKMVPPGGKIPFTLIFFEVPDGVEAFGAEVTEAQIPSL
jgi:predicted Zn finger-like uncharacterized protein